MLYKIFIRPILFLLNPETAHNLILKFISIFTFLYPLFKLIYNPGKLSEVKINDLTFRHPLGLAAGFDKNGVAIRFWEAIGFSHVEVGTITPLPQPGNPKPRIFRLKKDHALINRLGFNNSGADKIRKNILKAKEKIKKDFIVGINIGKNRNTPVEKAAGDYKVCMEKLYDVADYFTINISSPNTEGLRDLQQKVYLDNLLSEIQLLNNELSKEKIISSEKNTIQKNIFLKIAPDLMKEELEDIYEAAVKNKITGIIATNTTINRESLDEITNEQGGLSGKPLKQKSDKVLGMLNELNKENKNFFFIGVGGVFNKEDFHDKLNYGASLVQVYTGFIFEGPSLIKKIINQNVS
jgi:dihydroorotate dehydrogenase